MESSQIKIGHPYTYQGKAVVVVGKINDLQIVLHNGKRVSPKELEPRINKIPSKTFTSAKEKLDKLNHKILCLKQKTAH